VGDLAVKRVVALVLALALGGAAAPASADPVDVEIARRHFDLGRERYGRGDYAGAIAEFERARLVIPSPEMDFNLARCHDRLEHFAEAIAAYERFLAAAPTSPDAATVRERIATLRERHRIVTGAAVPAETPALPAVVEPSRSPPARRRWYAAPTAVAVGAVVIGAVGAGLLASVVPDYDALTKACAENGCQTPRWAEPMARANAGYGLLAVAGAAAIVDVALWIKLGRRRR
jgi:tetratricopeptide (TPR) repeat protein